MNHGMWVVLGWSAFVILTGIVFLVWGWRRGQFKDVEEAKYRMLEDREPAPWPDKEEKQRHG
ncbi:cbb3-type cytochrome oxidase assembly protein [Pseudodesulfovibrio karagichevae]|uniref:Cbb3-type cytochrome oxidase assembly protein n=1 Tax=Pseudodesulfovibrio karagichevae TaxID=3239305 RepID=A0ABV4K015_9BACT